MSYYPDPDWDEQKRQYNFVVALTCLGVILAIGAWAAIAGAPS